MTTTIDLREAEEEALREWREALQGDSQLDRAEKFLRFLDARHAALSSAPLAARGDAEVTAGSAQPFP
jgi:hypothetical protein